VEQLIILILFLLLPGLIRKLTGQQQKKRGASRPARPASPPGKPAAPEPDDQELPEWLQDLAETLADTKEQIEEAIPEIPGFEEQEEPEPAFESIPITSDTNWGRVDAAPASTPSVPKRHDAAPLTVPPRRPLHSPLRAREYVPKNKYDWRRAVILAEVLGSPRGLSPWRDPGIDGDGR